MGIAIAGTDERFRCLRDMLAESGVPARLIREEADLKGAGTLITKYPFPEAAEKGLDLLSPGARLILLNAVPVPGALSGRFSVSALSEDAAFINENAVLTAEGALSCAMQNAPFALTGERCMVIGYGRIGRALTEMLVGLRAVVTVVSRREAGRLQAMARGAYAASLPGMKPLLPDQKVVFVTSPERMLDREALSYIPKSAFVYDLSSAPYGVDHPAASEMGLNVRLESGLPGRYCPVSAAVSMYRAIMRIWNGGRVV